MTDPRLAAGVILALLALPAVAEAPDPAETAWRAMLDACLTYAETGAPAVWDGWERAQGADPVGFRLGEAATVEAVLPFRRASRLLVLCATSPQARVPGNDAAGLQLRAALSELSQGRLRFDPADQTGPADVYRGCAADGQEFRLASMTQTTWAHFLITVAAGDPPCQSLYPGV